MADKITGEFHTMDDILGGDIYFGLAESYQIRHLAAAIKTLKACAPVSAIISPAAIPSR